MRRAWTVFGSLPAGGKWWRFKYRFAGKEKRPFARGLSGRGPQGRASKSRSMPEMVATVKPSENRIANISAQSGQALNSFEVVARVVCPSFRRAGLSVTAGASSSLSSEMYFHGWEKKRFPTLTRWTCWASSSGSSACISRLLAIASHPQPHELLTTRFWKKRVSSRTPFRCAARKAGATSDVRRALGTDVSLFDG